MPYKDKEKGREYQREYKQRPEVKVRENIKAKERYRKNKEDICKRCRERYQKNKVKIRVRINEYRQTSEVKVRRRKYRKRLEVRERDRLKRNMLYSNDIKFRIINNLRRLLIKSFDCYSKTGKIYSSKKYGIDYKAIIEHLKPFPKNLKIKSLLSDFKLFFESRQFSISGMFE